MKERHMILVMLVILIILVLRFILGADTQEAISQEPISFGTNEELAVFVTLENQIARAEGAIGEDIESKKTPDYVNRYPNLYANPRTEWNSIEDGVKICYLTFDDGPSENTLKVLDVLDQYKIKAIFFVIGEEIELNDKNKEILKEISDRGHMIALHTYCHDYRTIYASVDAFLADYERVFNVIEEITGQRPYIYRFPGGSYNSSAKRVRKDIVEEMERRGFIYYDWNVSGEDSVGTPSSYTIMKNVKRDLTRYQLPVVLLHDGQTNQVTAKALSKIIEMISEKGYAFGRLDERFPCQFRW